MQLLNVYKPKGLTPLETIKLVKERFPEYKDEKIGYAGRLDPLAHGVLLLMVGEETTRQKDKYLNLPKEYEFEAVFGVATDTYDALGIPSFKVQSHQVIKNKLYNIQLDNLITQFIGSKLGKQTQIYPPFSSKTVKGKPLYWWTRNNKLSEIKIPQREIEIYDFKLLGIKEISAEKLKKEIMQQINSVKGDFRQKEIKKKWEEFFLTYCHFEEAKRREIPRGISQSLQDFEMTKFEVFQTARFTISCSSGTYVRSLVNELGKKLGTGAITLEILRIKVGEHKLNDSFRLLL